MRVKVTATRPAPLSIRELLTRMVRGQGPLEVVQRRQIPYWQERGWVRDGNRYSGSYQTRYGAFRGSIEQHGNHHFDFLFTTRRMRCGATRIGRAFKTAGRVGTWPIWLNGLQMSAPAS